MKDAVFQLSSICSFLIINLEESRFHLMDGKFKPKFHEANFSGAYIGRDTYFSMGNVYNLPMPTLQVRIFQT